MPTLYIMDDDEGETQLLAVKIGKIDPATATIAVLGALAKLEPVKKKRSDAGTKRPPRLLPDAANGGRSQVIP